MKMQQKLKGPGDLLNNSADSTTSLNIADSVRTRLIRLRTCGGESNNKSDRGDSSKKALVIDGPTLKHALDPSVKNLFRDVAEKFHSVICCRTTPLQKVGCIEPHSVVCPFTVMVHVIQLFVEASCCCVNSGGGGREGGRLQLIMCYIGRSGRAGKVWPGEDDTGYW